MSDAFDNIAKELDKDVLYLPRLSCFDFPTSPAVRGEDLPGRLRELAARDRRWTDTLSIELTPIMHPYLLISKKGRPTPAMGAV